MADLSEFLFDVKTELETRGHVLDDATIKEAAMRMTHPMVRQKIESGEWTVEQFVKEIEEGLRGMRGDAGSEMIGGAPKFAIEGGFANDSTGRRTDELRRQFGIR